MWTVNLIIHVCNTLQVIVVTSVRVLGYVYTYSFHNESEHFHVWIHLLFTQRRMKTTVNACGTENTYQSEDLRKRRPFEFM